MIIEIHHAVRGLTRNHLNLQWAIEVVMETRRCKGEPAPKQTGVTRMVVMEGRVRLDDRWNESVDLISFIESDKIWRDYVERSSKT